MPAYLPKVNTSFSIFLLAVSSLTLTACSSDEVIQEPSELDTISFSSPGMQSCFDFAREQGDWQTIADVKSLNCNDELIDSLEGIELLTQLETLDILRTAATEFDLSHNSELKKLTLWFNEKLTNLDLSNNVKLESIDLSHNGIQSLNISHLTDLKQAYLLDNPVEQIDLQYSNEIVELHLARGKLTSLDVSELTHLTNLFVYDNQLTHLDISQNPNLEIVNLSQNKIASVELQSNVFLQVLMVSHNLLESIDLSQNGELQKVDLQQNPLSDEALLYLDNIDWIPSLLY